MSRLYLKNVVTKSDKVGDSLHFKFICALQEGLVLPLLVVSGIFLLIPRSSGDYFDVELSKDSRCLWHKPLCR